MTNKNAVTDSKTGRYVYFSLLQTVRWMRRQKRRVFKKTSADWVKELSPLLGMMNALALLPTYVGVMCVPRHFFRNLGRTGKKTLPISLSPVKLLLQTATVISTLALVLSVTHLGSINRFANHVPDKWRILGLLAVICITTPIWATALTLIVEAGIILLIWVVAVPATIVFFVMVRNPVNFIYHLFKDGVGEFGEIVVVLGALAMIVIPLAIALPHGDCVWCRRVTLFYKIDFKKYLWGCLYISTVSFVWITIAFVELYQAYGRKLLGELNHDPTFWQLYLHILALLPFCFLARIAIASYFAMLESVSLYPRDSYYSRIARSLTKYKQKYLKKLAEVEAGSTGALSSWKGLTGDQRTIRSDLRDKAKFCMEIAARTELRFRTKPLMLGESASQRRLGLASVEDFSMCFEDEKDIALVTSVLALKS